MKLAIVGPYPPPYGGISVHIQRMGSYLASRNIDCVIYTDSGQKEDNVVEMGSPGKWMSKYLFTAKEDIIHLHYGGWKFRILGALMKYRGKKVIITLHGEGLDGQLNYSDELRRSIITPIIRFIMEHTAFIAVVNPRAKELLVSIGIDPRKIAVIPAFLPPVIRQEDVDEIPGSTWGFIEKHNPIISANATQIAFHKNEDLYGIDMCIDLCFELKKSYENIGFVFSLPNVNNHEYFEKMQDRVRDRDLDSNFLFLIKQCHFYPILLKSDLLVRPTNTDGYGVSLAESIHFGIPAIGSDVCKRPDGTILFQNRDSSDLLRKARDVLDNYEFYKKEIEGIKLENYAERLIKIYEKLGTGAK